MVKNIVRRIVHFFLIMFLNSSHDILAMQQIGRIAGQSVRQLPKRTPTGTQRIPQQIPRIPPTETTPAPIFRGQEPAIRPETQPGSFKPQNLPKLGETHAPHFPQGEMPLFEKLPETMPIGPTLPAPVFEAGTTLREAIKNIPDAIDLNNPPEKALREVQNKGFDVFLVAADATSFLGTTGLIPKNQLEWVTKNVDSQTYAASILLKNNNIITLVSIAGRPSRLIVVKPESPTQSLASYLESFSLPPTTHTKILINSETSQNGLAKQLAKSLKNAEEKIELKKTEQAEAEKAAQELKAKEEAEQKKQLEAQQKALAEKMQPMGAKEPAPQAPEEILPKKAAEPSATKPSAAEEPEFHLEAEQKRLAEEAEQKRLAEDKAFEELLKEIPTELDPQKLQEYRKQLIDEEKQLDQRQADELQHITTKFAEQQAEVQAEYDRQLQKSGQKTAEESREAKLKHEKEVKELKISLEKETQEIEKKYAQEKKEFDAQHELLQQKTKQARADRIAQIEKEELAIKNEEQIIEQNFQNKKNEIERRKKETQEKAAQEGKSEQATIENLERELADLQKKHNESTELLETQKKRITQAQEAVKQANQEFLQARKAHLAEIQKEAQTKLKALQDNKVKAEADVAAKKADLELLQKKEGENEKNLKTAQQNVHTKEQELEALQKQLADLAQQPEQLKKTLSEEEQRKQDLQKEEAIKAAELKEAELKKDLAEKEEARLKAEKEKNDAEKERIEKEEALKKAEQERLEAEKKTADQAAAATQAARLAETARLAAEAARLAEIAQKEMPPVGEKIEAEGGGGDGQLPPPEKELIAIPKTKIPEEKEKKALLQPALLVPAIGAMMLIEEEEEKEKKEPVTEEIPQKEMEKKVKQKKPQEPAAKTETLPRYPKPAKPSEQATEVPKKRYAPSAGPAGEPLRGTPFIPTPFPTEPPKPPLQPYLPRGTWTTSKTPTPSSTMPASGYSAPLSMPEQQLIAQPAAKPAEQARAKIPKKSYIPREILEALKKRTQAQLAPRQSRKSSWLAHYLQGLGLLKQAYEEKGAAETEKAIAPISEQKKANPALSFVKDVAVAIKEVFNNIIDTIGSYISSLLSPSPS